MGSMISTVHTKGDAMWPFTDPDAEKTAAREEKEWRDYRNHIADTLVRQGYRGEPVTVHEAYDWANQYVAETRRRLASYKENQ